LRFVTGEFNDSFPPIMDGVANVVKNYAYWLNKKYGSCYVITPAFPNYQDNEEFPVLRYYSVPLPTRHPYRCGIAGLDRTFLKRVREIPFDIVHAHSPFSAGGIGLDIARRRNIPIVVREAAATGCPSVLLEKTNAAEGVIDNYNGFLAHNNAGLYAERLFKLVADREKIRQVGLAAQETISKGWEELVDDVYENYLEIIDRYKVKNKS